MNRGRKGRKRVNESKEKEEWKAGTSWGCWEGSGQNGKRGRKEGGRGERDK